MVGLDTTVLVRYIMQDDPAQSAKATALIDGLNAESPGYVCLGAVVELVRVLSSSYRLQRSQVAAALDGLLRSQELVIDRADIVAQALRRYAKAGGADFADGLIERLGAAAGCSQTWTFDVAAVKSAGMSLVA